MRSAMRYLGPALLLLAVGCSKMNLKTVEPEGLPISALIKQNKIEKGKKYIDGAYVVVFKKKH